MDGGLWPRWSPGGDEIYFVRGLLASSVETENGLRAGAPRVIFDSPAFTGLDQGTSFDVAPDGRILVRLLPEDPNRSGEIVVVQNWFEELKRLAPLSR